MDFTISQEAETLVDRRRQQARARRLAKRAQDLAGAGRVDEAIDCQREVAALRPDDPVVFLRLGLLYREARRIEPALRAFRHAADLSPAHRDSREALIATLLEAGRYPELIGEAKALIRVAPRSTFARDILCISFFQLGQLEKALRVIGELVWLDPANPENYLRRAMLLQQQEKTKSAVGEYVRVLNMAPPESDAYVCAAESLEALDDHQIQQIILLAAEDHLFRWKMGRDPVEATEDRGFFLSPEGLMRLRHIADKHLGEPEGDAWSAVGRLRSYH